MWTAKFVQTTNSITTRIKKIKHSSGKEFQPVCIQRGEWPLSWSASVLCSSADTLLAGELGISNAFPLISFASRSFKWATAPLLRKKLHRCMRTSSARLPAVRCEANLKRRPRPHRTKTKRTKCTRQMGSARTEFHCRLNAFAILIVNTNYHFNSPI